MADVLAWHAMCLNLDLPRLHETYHSLSLQGMEEKVNELNNIDAQEVVFNIFWKRHHRHMKSDLSTLNQTSQVA